MLVKNYSKNGEHCRVTFKLPRAVNAETAALCGEFNNWNQTSHPMHKLKDGSFSKTVTLKTGQKHRFRYVLDGERWENDWRADEYLPNKHGQDDSVVIL